VIPLKLQRALLYASIREPTDWELENLPRVMLTADEPWDPGKIKDDPESQVVASSQDGTMNGDKKDSVSQTCRSNDSGRVDNRVKLGLQAYQPGDRGGVMCPIWQDTTQYQDANQS